MTDTHVLPRTRRTPLLGARVWSVVPAGAVQGFAGPVLQGAHGEIWTGPEMTAECRPPMLAAPARSGGPSWHGHANPPHRDCSCGVYAYKSPTETRKAVDDESIQLLGMVELSGLVLEGSYGYRAQQARITGPLELQARCDECGDAATGFKDSGWRYAVGCPRHLDGRSESLDSWLSRLERRYCGPILMTPRKD